ncbi:MAG: hypothetical protein U1E76_19010 [Planctomycetota bacterium]
MTLSTPLTLIPLITVPFLVIGVASFSSASASPRAAEAIRWTSRRGPLATSHHTQARSNDEVGAGAH